MFYFVSSKSMRVWLAGIRIAAILGLSLSAFGPAQVTPVYADKLICGVPGKDGPADINGVVNTYYPGTSDVDAGSTSIPVGSPLGSATPIAVGDLLVVIQMQGADINSTNTSAYGATSNVSAGTYEYVVATSAVVGGVVSISAPLENSYYNQNFPANNQGQRRYQVIRIPQYSNARIIGTVTALTWNGNVGGVVALDVAGELDLNGSSIDVTGQGFRGGGGIRYTGGTGLSTDYVTLSTNTTNASKGEGIAGTPRFVFNGSSVIDLGVEGYPNGSFARGAPGNAAGGGTDGKPSTNEENAGGGGGGNGGAGGQGGNAWFSGLPSGGLGGSAFPASSSKLVMGGGGGAGTINDHNPLNSSGGAGGGIVMVRTGTVVGAGTINANGVNGQTQPLNDAAGGAGAGGSVLVMAKNAALPGALNINARGGQGGNSWPTEPPTAPPPYFSSLHGPGGGGGGGVIYLSSTAGTLSAAQGQNGTASNANSPFGAEPGQPGKINTSAPKPGGGIAGAECIPALNVVKSQTSTGPYVAGDTISYSIVVTNTGNVTLTGVTVSDDSATLGVCTPVQPASLAPAATMTCAASHVVTQADVSSGSYVNTATADSNETEPGTSTVRVPLTSTPTLSVVKSQTSTGPYVAGDTISYSIVVTNTGNVTLTGVTVSDDSATLGACTPVQPASLAPAATMTCAASHVVTQADVSSGSYVNTATADSNETEPDTSTVTVPLTAIPSLTVVKSQMSTGPYTVGDTISYSIVVTNDGDVALTGVTVSDDSATLGVCTPVQPASLAPAATMTCAASHVVTQADVSSGSYVNTATADSNETEPGTSTVRVPLTSTPTLSVVKSQTSTGPYVAGDTISYSIVVTNTGNVTLTGVTVSDDSATLGACTPVQPASLAPAATMTCAASHVVTQADVSSGSYVNTATADSNETQPGTSTVTVPFRVADLSLSKSVSNQNPSVSSNINFTLTVSNIGPDPASGVEVTDQLPAGYTFVTSSASKGTYASATGTWVIGDLAVNEAATLTMTVTVNASGPYTNVAEITGSLLIDPDSTPDNNNPDEDDQDAVTVNLSSGTPATPAPRTSGFQIPVTGFKADVATDLSKVPVEMYAATDDVLLEIPSLGVKIPIVGVPKKNGTWNVAWLGNQAGWLEGSAFPSWNGNSVLTSHLYLANGKPGPFVNLSRMKFGEKIIVHAYGQTYTFEVQTNTTVLPNDASVMKHEEKPWLTLVTCKNYDEKSGTYLNRVVVRAVLVSVDWE